MPPHKILRRKLPKIKIQYVEHGRLRTQFVAMGTKREHRTTGQATTFLRGTHEMETDGTQMEDGHLEAQQPKTHQQQKVKRSSAWDSHFSSMMKAFTEVHYPLTFQCSRCNEEEPKIICCQDCFPHQYLCQSCFVQEHKHHLLHKALQWNDEEHTYKAFYLDMMNEPEVKIVGHEDCPTLYWKNLVVVDSEEENAYKSPKEDVYSIDLKPLQSSTDKLSHLPASGASKIIHSETFASGLQQNLRVWFCDCEPEVATLVKHQLWPSSPSDPCVAFHFKLMETLRMLVLESQLSIKGFFESLKWKNDGNLQNNILIKELYRCVSGESFEMYRRFKYTATHLHHLYPEFDDGTACPACPSEEDADDMDKRLIYSFDANFGLVRRKTAGISAKVPFHTGHFFINQEEVDDFVENYKQQPNDKGCSDFQAGSDLRSKNKSNKLSETGIFGASCRHEYPKSFFNLKHGERLSNAVFLLKHLKKSDRHITILYDIACKLKAHLEKTQVFPSLLSNVSLGIPIFHCFGHQMKCQVNYSPRRIDGIGMTDGETMERLWSYLRRFKKITKEMQEDHRHDLLVDALLHFGVKLRRKMVPYLCQRLEKASAAEDVYTKEMTMIAPNAGEEEVDSWFIHEEELMQRKKLNVLRDEGWKGEYALKLHELSCLSEVHNRTHNEDVEKSGTLVEIQRLEKAVETTEQKHRIQQRWNINSDDFLFHLCLAVEDAQSDLLDHLRAMAYEHMCLKEAMKKYADGQATSARIAKQMKAVNKKIKQGCEKYNTLPPVHTDYPESVQPTEVKAFDSDMWSTIKTIHKVNSFSVQHQAVDLRCRIKRAKEEQTLIKEELKRVLSFHLRQLELLDKVQITSLFGETSQYLLGAQALIKQHICVKMRYLHESIVALQDTINTSSFKEHLQELSVSMDKPIQLCQLSDDSDCDSSDSDFE